MKDSNSIDNALNQAKRLMQQGQFSAAKTQLTALAESYDAPLETHYFLAVCQRKLGLLNDAKLTLENLLKLSPKYGHAHQERGHLYQQTGDPRAAAQAWWKAVALNPALHGAWRALCALPDQTTNNRAQRQLTWLDSLPPELISIASFIHQGKLHKAESLCRQFLQRHPRHPEAMRLLAQLGIKFHVLDDAELLLSTCLQFDPEHLHARLDMVDVLQRRQKYPEALQQAQILHDFDPNNVAFQTALANALQANGSYEKASDQYRKAIRQSPDNASIHVALGNALKTANQTDTAISAYQAAYQVQPDYGDAYWSLANLKTYRFSEQELSQMHAQLDAIQPHTQQIEDIDRARIHFALGKAYEDQANYHLSFEHYQQGNAIKASENAFDLKRLRHELNHQKTHFTADFFTQRAGFGCPSPDPIFIVGLPRAGSTLLEQILASHSCIDGTMELANIIAYAHRFNGRSTAQEDPKYPAILAKMTAKQAHHIGQTYLQETQAHRQGAPFFIDKMPNNFRHIALLKLILPNAKIIDARRAPMACCFSGFKQLFAEGQEFSYSLTDIGHYYQEYVNVMRHWEVTLPSAVLRVQHEDVLDDLEGQVRRMLNFCGLEFEQACVDFHQSKRAVRTPSSEQVRQPIFKTAQHQWQHYSDHLTPLRRIIDDL